MRWSADLEAELLARLNAPSSPRFPWRRVVVLVVFSLLVLGLVLVPASGLEAGF